MNEELDGIFDHDRQLDEAPTRKHFRMVADLIKANPAPAKRNELAKHHAEIFAKQNPRFDREKFMKACDADGTCGSPAAPARYSPKNMSEGSYQGSQRELRGQRKGSRKLLRKALAKGDKKGAADWMENIKDADDQIKSKKKVNEARAPFIDHGAIEDRVKWGPHGMAAAKALRKKHKASGSPFSLSRADVVKAALAAKAAAEAKNKPAGN